MSRRSLNLDDTLYDYLLAHSLREHPEHWAAVYPMTWKRPG